MAAPDALQAGLTTVIVPVLNEIATLEELVTRVERAPFEKEIVVIDGGSTDGTLALVERLGREGRVIAMTGARPRGKGEALRFGIARARGSVVIVQDGDLEYDPGEIPRVIAPLHAGTADVCYGARVMLRERRPSRTFYWGGRIVSLATTLLYGVRVSDEPTCYKAFRTEVVRRIPLEGIGFELEPEVTAKVLRLGLRYVEVPVSYYPRSMAEGKKIRWTDGLEALWTLLRWRFARIATVD